MTKDQKAAVLGLLKDVAESEHQLRHQGAFETLCAELGFEKVTEPHRITVRDPVADAEAEQASAAKAEAEKALSAAAEPKKK